MIRSGCGPAVRNWNPDRNWVSLGITTKPWADILWPNKMAHIPDMIGYIGYMIGCMAVLEF